MMTVNGKSPEKIGGKKAVATLEKDAKKIAKAVSYIVKDALKKNGYADAAARAAAVEDITYLCVGTKESKNNIFVYGTFNKLSSSGKKVIELKTTEDFFDSKETQLIGIFQAASAVYWYATRQDATKLSQLEFSRVFSSVAKTYGVDMKMSKHRPRIETTAVDDAVTFAKTLEDFESFLSDNIDIAKKEARAATAKKETSIVDTLYAKIGKLSEQDRLALMYKLLYDYDYDYDKYTKKLSKIPVTVVTS